MQTEIHSIRIPRKVVGTSPRARNVDAFLVADAVPVEIRAYGSHEAPATFRDGRGRVHRMVDGMPYMPVGEGGFEAAWDALFERLRPELLFQVHMGPYLGLEETRHVHGWYRHLLGVNTRHGLSTEAPVFRRTIDDGRTEQANAALFMADRIAMVDGTLMLRTGLPRARAAVFDTSYNVIELADPLGWDEDPDLGKPLAGGDFRIDEFDGAAALAADVGRSMRVKPNKIEACCEVIDAGAVSACYERFGTQRLFDLIGTGNGVLEAMSYKLAKYPREEIARFIELSRLLEMRDEEGLAEWMQGVEETASILRRIPSGSDPEFHKRNSEISFALAAARYRDFIVPAHNLRTGDAAALASI